MPEPTRMCVACRGRGPQADLVRLVVADGRIVTDGRPRLPGRGCYLHRDCVVHPRAGGAITRALRVPVDSDLLRRVSGGPTAGSA